MSTLFGPMRQIGYVVRDIEKAMRHWVEVNQVGPWFYAERYAVDEFWYGGVRQKDLEVSVALSNCGDMQLELIQQQRCDTPSMFQDFLAAGHEGMQHFAVWPDDYDGLFQRALSAGFAVGQEGRLPRGRFVYFRNEDHPGTVVELSEMTPMRRQILPAIRDAAMNWDGSDPIRRV